MSSDSLGDASVETPAITANTATPPPRGYVLTGEGLRPVGDPRAEAEGEPPLGQVFLCTVYLKRCWAPAKTAGHESYWLKHEVERHVFERPDSVYVCNGALIQAALNLGLRVEPYGQGSVNALVYVKRPPNWKGARCERDGCVCL